MKSGKPRLVERDDFYPDDVGVVYVISDTAGNVKIGVSTLRGFLSRLRGLQNGNALKLTPRYRLECPQERAFAIENRTKRLLNDRRIRGEWFKVSWQEAIDAVNSAKKHEEDHQILLRELAKANDVIKEKRTLEAKESQDDDNKPEQSIFDMMLEEGNFAPETRRKRSIFND
jgi:hypothetical protein